MATIGTVAIAVGAVPHTFNTGDTLTSADLNANFAALEQRLAAIEAGQVVRKIARAHGDGPDDPTAAGAIATRHLQYTKVQDETGLRIVWGDNLRCYGAIASCEWEIKIDGASCATPGPLKFDVYNDVGGSLTVNLLRPQVLVATCFGVSKGPHTIQVYVKAPIPGRTETGQPLTGFSAAYWSLEAEEVN